MSAGFAVIVSFTVKPESRTRFMSMLRDNARASVEEEPECLRFDVLEPPQRPLEVWLYEIYRDRPAFDAHLRTPHFLSFDAATRDMTTGKTVIAASLEEAA